MALLWQAIAVTSFVYSYSCTSRTPTWVVSHFIGNFAIAWTAQVLVWATWSVVIWPRFFSPLRDLPGPKDNSFFMGQFFKIFSQPTGMPMLEWINTIPNDGIIRYLGFLNGERILLTSPKSLSEVLVARGYEFIKPEGLTRTLSRTLGLGIIFAEGDEHRKQRRNLMPAFAFRHIKDLYPVFWDKARESVQAMAQQVTPNAAEEPTPAGGEPQSDTAVLEVHNWASRTTLDIIGVAGLGRDFGAIQDPKNELIRTYERIMTPSRKAQIMDMLSLLLPRLPLKLFPLKHHKEVDEAVKVIRETCRDLIREKRVKLASKEFTGVDILSVALDSSVFADDNLVDQLMTFLVAGHETTATAMTWAIYMMCVHPDVQDRLRAEVRASLPAISDASACVSSADIDRMPYLSAVCSEVLRVWNPVPVTIRVAPRDTTVLGHRIPKGTQILVAPWAVNRSRDLWGPDALDFNPERWLADSPARPGPAAAGGASSNYAFLSFLHGPRSCIGAGFAKAEFACLLAAWVGRFEFRLRDVELMDPEKLELRSGVTSQPKNGLHVKARVLEGW